MGISEVFATVASFEFAYLAAPRSAQSLIMSLRFCSLGLSSFIGEGYIRIFTRTNKTFEFDVSISSQRNFEYIYSRIFFSVERVMIFYTFISMFLVVFNYWLVLFLFYAIANLKYFD